MFQNLLKLLVPLSKYNILKIKVIFWYFKRKYVIYAGHSLISKLRLMAYTLDILANALVLITGVV